MREGRWPLHPPPFEGESVMSWLGRVARCYRIDAKKLLKQELGFEDPLGSLMIRLPTGLLSSLSIRTGVPEHNIQSMTLSTWSPFFLDDLTLISADFTSYVDAFPLFSSLKKRNKTFRPKRPWLPWLRSSDTTVIKACPRCIQARPAGVISLVWHLSVLLSCPLHQCMLGYCKTYQGSFICWMNKAMPMNSAPLPIAVMDKRTWAALTVGRVDLPGRTVHGAVWLRLLRALVDELHVPTSRTSFSGAGHIIDTWSSLGLGSRAGVHRWQPYEFLPNDIQDKTLLAAAAILDRIETGRISLYGEQAMLFSPP